MPQAEFRHDMSLMLAMHDALRRELAQVARIAGLPDDHPSTLLHAALAWDLLKELLTARHKSEDDTPWPPLRAAMADNSGGVALADELEAEHAEIAPLLAATAGLDYGSHRLEDIVDELSGKQTAHLDYEAAGGLPPADVWLSGRSSSTSAGSTPSGLAGTRRWPCPGCWVKQPRRPATRCSVSSPRRCRPPSASRGSPGSPR